MLRTINASPTLWDAILPECCLGLPPGLAAVDVPLDDPRFFVPFEPFFSARQGRPSIPIETYLRMMFLRFRYKLGFETLCAEVSDSIAWRRFCRIPLDTAVPHPTTLLKITARCGPGLVDGLNEALLAKAAEDKLVRLDKVRVDTTVVEANVSYPTDSGLLGKGVAALARLVMVVKVAGLAKSTRFRDRGRSVRRRAHDVAVWLRRRNDDAKAEVLAITDQLADLAELTIADARQVAVNARRTCGDRDLSGRDGLSGRWPRSTGCPACSRRSWPRPGCASPAASPTVPPGSSHCTTPTPDRSATAASAARSSSATRPRSPTTSTGSSSSTVS